jgi:hypothetical protein
VDKIINNKGGFPISDYRSLLHMVYNPVENRFYKPVAVTVHEESDQTLNVRDNPKKTSTSRRDNIILIPTGDISEWEEAINYKEFSKTISN